MKIKRLVFAGTVAAAVLVPASVASADILISVPPSPVAPPFPEPTYRVDQPAPVSVSVLFLPDPGPPTVLLPDPGPPG